MEKYSKYICVIKSTSTCKHLYCQVQLSQYICKWFICQFNVIIYKGIIRNHKEMSIKGKSDGNPGESQGSHGKPQVNHGKSQGNQKGIMGNHKRIMGNHKGITRVDDGILELTKKSYDKDTHIKYHYLIKQTTKTQTGEKK